MSTRRAGSIETGKLADLIVLSDILSGPAERIRDVRVTMTAGGKVVVEQ